MKLLFPPTSCALVRNTMSPPSGLRPGDQCPLLKINDPLLLEQVSAFLLLVGPLSVLTVTKMCSRQSKSRISSAVFIEENGFEVLPCSRCEPKNLLCIMAEELKKCSKCTRDGRCCDGSGVPLDSCVCLSLPIAFSSCLLIFSV
jgi:hypothetical protein